MCDGIFYDIKNYTARDLHAIYQREYVFKTLKNNIVSDPFAKYEYSNRIIARNKVLEHKLMAIIGTPPDLFDISKYRQPPGNFEKKAYQHIINLLPDWHYFITMIDRPYYDLMNYTRVGRQK